MFTQTRTHIPTPDERPPARLRVIVLQMIGGVTASGESRGGVRHFTGLARAWTASGTNCWFVTNLADHGLPEYHGVTVRLRAPTLRGSHGASSSTAQIIFNHIVQRDALKRLAAEAGRDPSLRTIILAASPYLPDLCAAILLRRLLNSPAIVFHHHLTPPPWRFALRRGGIVRSSAAWFWSIVGLVACKVTGMPIALDQPGSLSQTPWRMPGVISDPEPLPAFPVEVNNDARSVDACFVSPQTMEKGVIDLLLAWRHVVDHVPTAQLVIAGAPGPSGTRKRVARIIVELGLADSVEVRGFLSSEDKSRLLLDSRLFVLPSYVEGWSLSVMEAAAHGALPVTYDLPAFDYLGPAAVRVRTGSPLDLATAIIRLLADERNRLTRAESVRRAVSQYSMPTVASELLRSIQEAV